MARRGHSTTIGKFAKGYYDRRRSEIRIFAEQLRREQERDLTSAEENPATASHR